MIGKHKKARSDSTSKILNYVLGKAGAEVLDTNLCRRCLTPKP